MGLAPPVLAAFVLRCCSVVGRNNREAAFSSEVVHGLSVDNLESRATSLCETVDNGIRRRTVLAEKPVGHLGDDFRVGGDGDKFRRRDGASAVEGKKGFHTPVQRQRQKTRSKI